MRYRIRGHGIISSENAAKPPSQKNKFLVNAIACLDPVERTLDYGSGKLRYLHDILKKSDFVSIVDSDIQNNRMQIIFGKYQCISDLYIGDNAVEVLTSKELNGVTCYYDRAFLLNVLQIVPIPQIRLVILQRIYKSLRSGGQLFAVVQYRNSDFTRMLSMDNASKFRDGMVIKHLRGTSFYAFIRPAEFQSLITQAGFIITKCKLHDGSCYVWAERN